MSAGKRPMQIAVGSDHAGFELKEDLLKLLREQEYRPLDMGAFSDAAVDFPDIAQKVGNAVNSSQCERGILICGSGIGASVAANKIRGIRAGLCHDLFSARQSVEHVSANVLVMGGLVIGKALAREISLAFLRARFSEEERFVRRIRKIEAIEEEGHLVDAGPAGPRLGRE